MTDSQRDYFTSGFFTARHGDNYLSGIISEVEIVPGKRLRWNPRVTLVQQAHGGPFITTSEVEVDSLDDETWATMLASDEFWIVGEMEIGPLGRADLDADTPMDLWRKIRLELELDISPQPSFLSPLPTSPAHPQVHEYEWFMELVHQHDLHLATESSLSYPA